MVRPIQNVSGIAPRDYRNDPWGEPGGKHQSSQPRTTGAGTFARVTVRLRRLVHTLAALALLAAPASAVAAPHPATGLGGRKIVGRPPAREDLRADHDAARRAGSALRNHRRAVPADQRRHGARQPHRHPHQRGPDGKGLEEVKTAPTAADIAGLGDGYYLNLTGEALGDTCVYARDFEKLERGRQGAGRSPTPTSPAKPTTPASSSSTGSSGTSTSSTTSTRATGRGCSSPSKRKRPPQALEEEPCEIILFQHAGGERADWSDPKVQKEGTHPIVYPAAGSHATFYDSAVYIENGQHGSGLGCDNTSEPLRELRPRPVLLPEPRPPNAAGSSGSATTALGRKGKGLQQRPDRAATKTVWTEPFAWMAEQRSTSPRLPAGSIVGPADDQSLLRSRRRGLGLDQPRRRSHGPRRSCVACRPDPPDRPLPRPHPLAPGRPRRSCGPGAPSAS